MTGRRRIVHVDMDAFFCAIEELINPGLKGKPVVVGADPKSGSGRGVVSTANYTARKFGIHSAMPVSQAYRLCPGAVFVPPRMNTYGGYSKKVMAVLENFSPLVEQISVDEAFLDCSGTREIFGRAESLASKIRSAVYEKTGLTCSVGIATNKSVAKIASDLNKPNGQTICPPGQERQFLAPLKLERLWGAGKKTIEKLNRLGYYTIGDVASSEKKQLESLLGKWGSRLYWLANGVDDRPLQPSTRRKSISAERTFAEDTSDTGFLEGRLFKIADELARAMRQEQIRGRTITLKVRLTGFETFSRSHTWHNYVSDSDAIRRASLDLFSAFDRKGKAVRLIGIAISNLDINEPQGAQLGLFAEDVNAKKQTDLVLDNLKEKFGNEVTRASFLK